MKRFFIVITALALFVSIPFFTVFLLGQVGNGDKIMLCDAGKKIKMDRRDFLISATASVCSEDFHDEALKAVVTVFSTLIAQGEISVDSSRGVLLIDTEKIDENFKSRVISAVDMVGENVILYDKKPIYAVYHLSSGGKTVSGENLFEGEYPYLLSVLSDEKKGKMVFSKDELSLKGVSFPITIEKTAPDGFVKTVRVGDNVITGQEFREKLSIPSTVFSLYEDEYNLYISYSGIGHGVGLSLLGANNMANIGKNHTEILTYYYQNTEIAKILE